MERQFSPELFKKVDRNAAHAERIKRPTIKYWADVWRRLKNNKLAMFGLIIIVLMVLFAIIGPMISGYTYYEMDMVKTNQRPSADFWFGTDSLGRDLFTRATYGARFSLLIGFLAAFINITVGVLYGGIAGMSSGKVDAILMRIAEIIYSIPYLLIVILLSVVFAEKGSGTSFAVMVFAMTLSGWIPTAILVRGQVLSLKQSEYVMAARSMGANDAWVLFKHIIPNTLGPILVNLTLIIPRAIFSEATLSFVSLGLQDPLPSLGNLANSGLEVLAIGLSYQMIVPALMISLIMFGFNVLGDGLRDALDPRLRK
ncbi:oligopeptide transport system permease protein [Peptoniphilus asaccharolyticus DSM 20463]|uniref:Oligopeptide transport system permease protein n=1 Tax=Peptoniphilus asaccharolyticus DSM 20463 TaxID=573058 RepID=A0A1W1V0K5_PEPAS|nr:ABC transporter permease [Peptoniphilus asaccharolyticus]MBL7575457.1 ABC transporter permease [Peptoniphilus asaccharolyticus]SMB86830.1 oligopeptide transport system permease protein [Peptoniphilus asaccharolyticus DSM 20463]